MTPHMPTELWASVDDFLCSTLGPEDAPLQEAHAASKHAGLPAIQVAPAQGRFLMVMALAARADRILEIGTLGGYSTIWLARGLAPGGRVTSLEVNPQYAAVARENIARAGLSDRVEVLVGPASDSLVRLPRTSAFDMVFIDADKESTAAYIDAAAELCRPGALIIVDNVVRDGEVIDADSTDPRVQGVRTGLSLLGSHPRLISAALQVVGAKGHDGMAFAVVRPN